MRRICDYIFAYGETYTGTGIPIEPFCDPGVARIELRAMPELRGTPESLSLRNAALAPEMQAIGRFLFSYRGLARPHGTEHELKQADFGLWDSAGIFRINMSGPVWRGPTYRSPFNGVLSLSARLSFNQERDRSLRAVAYSTMGN